MTIPSNGLEQRIDRAFNRYKGNERLHWNSYEMGITERIDHTFLYLLDRCFREFKGNMLDDTNIADFYKNLDEGTAVVIEGADVPKRFPSVLVTGTTGVSKSTTVGDAVITGDEDFMYLKRFVGTTVLRVQSRNSYEVSRIGDALWRLLSGPLIVAFAAIDTAVMSVNLGASRKEKVSTEINEWYKEVSVSYDIANVAILATIDAPVVQKYDLKKVTVRG